MDFYSAEYDASGQIVKYEKITYPNCQGTPITINTEDGVFRLPEYTINSAPKTGQAPYTISYVASLPTFLNPTSVEAMSDSEVENKAVVDGEETGLAINENKTEIKTN